MEAESSNCVMTPDDLSQSQTENSCSHEKVRDGSTKEKLGRIPKVTDPEFRIACDEIAESLSKKWRFKLSIFGMIVLSGLVFLGALGWTMNNLLETEIRTTKVKVDKFIETEFQKENIKKTIQQVASNQASKLMQDQIQPLVTKSMEDFYHYLDDQKKIIDKDMATLKQEINKLQERNSVMNLADKAIVQGDVSSFQELKKMLINSPANIAVTAEFYRVIAAYLSPAPRRWIPPLNTRDINPYAKSDQELSEWELLQVLKNPNNSNKSLVRARAAKLLVPKSVPGSNSTAKAISDAIKNENNLEVIFWLKEVFAHVTGYSSNEIDGSDIELWQKNKLEITKKNVDAK